MKKWTFLLAAGLLAGATPVFTGCIDNDEPEGITILRGAKAELIKAKKALIEAEVIRAEADAEYRKAEAELKRAQADLERAKIKKIEAQAEAEKAKAEAEIKQLEAETAEIIKRTELAVQEALIKQKQALEALRQAEANATKAQWDALQNYRDAYDEASDKYYEKTKEVLAKQEALAKAEKGSKVGVEEKRQAEKDVKDAEDALADAKEVLEALKLEAEEQIGSMKPGEIPAKIKELDEQIKQLERSIQMVEVERAEAVQKDPAYAKLTELQNALEGAGDAEIEIAEFKNTISPADAKYWNYDADEVIVESGKFSLNDMTDYYAAYRKLDSFLSAAKKYSMDEDDVKWNNALINEMTAELEAAKKNLKVDEDLFSAAVKGYNDGKGVNVTAYIGYDKLDAAVKAYNDAADKLDAQKVETAKKYKLYTAAVKAYNDKAQVKDEYPTKLWEKKRAAEETAHAAYDAKVTAAGVEMQGVIVPLQTKLAEAQDKLAECEKIEALARIKAEQNPDNLDLQTALTTAENNTKNARNNVNTAQTTLDNALISEQTKFDNKINVALAERDLEIQRAENAYNKDLREWQNTLEPSFQAELDELEKAMNVAWDAFEDEQKKLDTDPVYKAIGDVNDAYYKIDIVKKGFNNHDFYHDELTKVYHSINLIWDVENLEDVACYDLDVKKAFVVDKGRDKGYLQFVSSALYGGIYADEMNDQNWPSQRITPLDRAGVDAIIKANYPDLEEYQYHHYYSNFGKFGRQILSNEVDIEIAKSYIANSKTFDEVIKVASDALAVLEESYEKAEKAREEALKAVDAQQLVVDEIGEAFDLKIRGFEKEKTILSDIQKAYAGINLDEDEKYTEESIEEIKEALLAEIEEKEKGIYDFETAVLIAKEKQEALGKPDADKVEEAQFDLEMAKLDQERAKNEMKKAEDELKAAVNKILGTEENA